MCPGGAAPVSSQVLVWRIHSFAAQAARQDLVGGALLESSVRQRGFQAPVLVLATRKIRLSIEAFA
jgi:hypothetical protein